MIIELAKVKASPYQVRTQDFDDSVVELAESIKQHGLLQPIKVRPVEDGYELIYGHRRLAAMRHLGWESCEAVIEGMDDDASRVQGLIENLQRKDISSVELGEGLKDLQASTGWSQREIADKLGISASSVGVALRLVDRLSDALKPLVQSAGAGGRFVEDGLSSYQAYEVSLTSDNPKVQERLAEKVIRERIPHPQIREMRKVLLSIPLDDEEMQHRFFSTPWTKSADQVVQEARIFYQPETKTLPSEGPLNQWHGKCLWNARRIPSLRIQFATIGYSERSLEQFVEILLAAGIQVLVDARADPISQFKPDFSKRNLEQAVTSKGIRYVHIRALGVPYEKRQQFRQDQDAGSFFEWYDNEVANAAMEYLLDPNLAKPVAVMCVELDPTRCHRHRIALALEERGYLTLDL